MSSDSNEPGCLTWIIIFFAFIFAFNRINDLEEDVAQLKLDTTMNSNIDNPEARIIRSEALQWWALCTPEDRVAYCEAHVGNERHPATLKGSEIEQIYVNSLK